MVTLVQLEYIVAVDTYRHFATAAENCFVTQPTLSMQIKKLEDHLGVQVFDRSRHPVEPTKVGQLVIGQARKLLRESQKITEIVEEYNQLLGGELRIGIIPTLGPYLLPSFIGDFARLYPNFEIKVKEMKTSEIIQALRNDQLDVGLLVTPVNATDIAKRILFFEEILVYMGEGHPLSKEQEVEPEALTPDSLWLLSEGHCFRGQMVNICQMQQQTGKEMPIKYESGSLETLRKLVEKEGGYTLLPELALGQENSKGVIAKKIVGEKPLREVSLVYINNFARARVLDILVSEILKTIPEYMKDGSRGRVVDWN